MRVILLEKLAHRRQNGKYIYRLLEIKSVYLPLNGADICELAKIRTGRSKSGRVRKSERERESATKTERKMKTDCLEPYFIPINSTKCQ